MKLSREHQVLIPAISFPSLRCRFQSLHHRHFRHSSTTRDKAWVFASRNPNLGISGHFAAEVQPGINGFGFIVTVSVSLMQVAVYRGRYLLRDGYHRAYGFLRQGIARVAVLVRELETFNDLALPAGMLDQDSFLGDRPPFLTDYLDDSVAISVELPATQKTIVIQGLELAVLS